MPIRQPIVAGRFYPSDAAACRADLEDCIRRSTTHEVLPETLCGGIVPHAGWMCSGAVTAGVFGALATRCEPDVVVLLSAVHSWPGKQGGVFARGSWATPLGEIPIAEEVAAKLLAASVLLIDAPDAHREEHALEVQIPFVKHFFHGASIVPIMTPPNENAASIGESLAQVLSESSTNAIVIGSTDLTHYGPSYRFTPHGEGADGLTWAREVNDRRMIELIQNFATDRIISEAATQRNACGAGAIVATLTAAKGLGGARVCVVEHTTSHEVLGGPPIDAVGYLGAVIGS